MAVITSENYFDSNSALTLTWKATYNKNSTLSKFILTETIYRTKDGANARFVKLSLDSDRFVKPKDAALKEPTAIKLTLQKEGLTPAVQWTNDKGITFYDSESGGSATTSGDSVWIRAQDCTIGEHPKITATVTDPTWGVFTDEQTILVQDAGSDALSVLVSNESVNLPADQDGVVSDYPEGGTSIAVYEGASKLSYGSGNGQYTVTDDGGININPDASPTTVNKERVYSEPSSLSEAQGSITFTISGKRKDSTTFSFSKKQTFSRGDAGQDAWSIELNKTSVSVVENADGSVNQPTVTLTPVIRKGEVIKTGDYEIKSATGADLTFSQNSTNITVTALNSDSEILEIVYEPSGSNPGPDLTASCSFALQKSGSKGPGTLYIGEYDDLVTKVYNSVAGDRPLNNNDLGRDVISTGDQENYYGFSGPDGTLLSAAGDPSLDLTNWSPFESYGNVAIKALLTDTSFVKTTLNVGLNPDGDSANITLYGASSNPYLSVGQSSPGYDAEGIFLGMNNGAERFSLKSSGGDYLKWTGTELTASGEAQFKRGKIAGWDLDSDYIRKISGTKEVRLSSASTSLEMYEDSIRRIQMGLFSSTDPTSFTNNGFLNASNWTATNSGDGLNAQTVFNGTDNEVEFSLENLGTPGATADHEFKLTQDLGTIDPDSTLSIKSDARSYSDSDCSIIITVKLFQNASTSPSEIADFTVSRTLNTTSVLQNDAQTIDLSSYSSSGYSDVRAEVTISAQKPVNGGITIFTVTLLNFELYVNTPLVEVNTDNVLFFTSPTKYLQWSKDSLNIKGGDIETQKLKTGSLEVYGKVSLFGDLEASSMPPSNSAPLDIVTPGNAYVGTSTAYARADHKHEIADSVILNGIAGNNIAPNNITAVDGTFSGDMTITGNLEVGGVLDQINAENLLVEDHQIWVNSGGTDASSQDAGLYVDHSSDKYIRWDEAKGYWETSSRLNVPFLGVGVTTPSYPVHIGVNTRIDGKMGIGASPGDVDLTIIGNSAYAQIQLQNLSSTAATGVYLYSEDNSGIGIWGLNNSGHSDAYTMYLYQAYAHDIKFMTGATERMRITGAGAIQLSSQATAANEALRADRALTLTGTSNQISVTGGTQNLTSNRTWSFSLPQDIHSGADPTFNSLTLTTSASIGTDLNVTGDSFLTGLLDIGGTGSSAKLSVYRSGGTVFEVLGDQGQLFSITDDLSGTLFSVNDISGLSILSVDADDRIVMGTFGSNGLVIDGTLIGIGIETPTEALDISGNIKLTGLVDSRDIAGDGAKLDDLYDTIGLKALTAAEVDQIENIGAITISSTQWGYLGSFDQNLRTTDSVNFTDGAFSDTLFVNGLNVEDRILDNESDILINYGEIEALWDHKISYYSDAILDNLKLNSWTKDSILFLTTDGQVKEDSNFTWNESTLHIKGTGELITLDKTSGLDGEDAWIGLGNGTYDWRIGYKGSTAGEDGNEFWIRSDYDTDTELLYDHLGNLSINSQYYFGADGNIGSGVSDPQSAIDIYKGSGAGAVTMLQMKSKHDTAANSLVYGIEFAPRELAYIVEEGGSQTSFEIVTKAGAGGNFLAGGGNIHLLPVGGVSVGMKDPAAKFAVQADTNDKSNIAAYYDSDEVLRSFLDDYGQQK